jgi:elongator complex protein 3
MAGDYTGMSETTSREEAWLRARDYSDETRRTAARAVLHDLVHGVTLRAALHRHPAKGSYLAKDALVHAYREMVAAGEISESPAILRALRMKPVRTLSGVATVTVLTKPYPCPGECIFCPTDARMPKSYLVDEPGAMRAGQHDFDPFAQTQSRLESLAAVGHPVDKIELLILGGTWSAYRRDYQSWFVQRCL